uniref:Taste receptor, type 1, member 2b n=1 Tax=Takifugu rubripes TaxID=31033 RepID=Q2MHJ9_TAKRU|nr:taste receptor, type 1, member 2b precursor [Takifugu rubripes]BAE78488.1 taste receptor, type 1, member 2b [Takifugu rubripes]
MGCSLACLCLLGCVLYPLAQCTVPASEFRLEGDYLIGGLFEIHYEAFPTFHGRPQTMDCSSKFLILSNYRRFQLMRFAVAEINNSTSLLPNVTLGYEVFDHCTDAQSFSDVFKLLSVNNVIQPWNVPNKNVSKVVAVLGLFSSTSTLTVAPLFMSDFIPLISYGSSSSIFSEKAKFPSFLRTVHSSKKVMEVIVKILQYFKWHWVAFLYSSDDYGTDGLKLFIEKIKDTEICLAYTHSLDSSHYLSVFNQIDAQRINLIVVFAPHWHAIPLVQAAIRHNVTGKVWIAGEAWSLNKELPKEKGIKNIGTVIGVSQPVVTIPGFEDFLYSVKKGNRCESTEQQFCNQIYNCSQESADILAADPSYSFSVYSAVYSTAHALHNVLNCDFGKCDNGIPISPPVLLAQLKKSNFTLLTERVQFDENGDPRFGSYAVLFWNQTGDPENFGTCCFYPSVKIFINDSKIQWHSKEVPISQCSKDCKEGYAKRIEGIHQCCFKCEICPNGTFVNRTKDPFNCIDCEEHQWSAAGSTSCLPRTVEYVAFTDTAAVVILVGAGLLLALTLAMCVLFAINYNTPVVRSAGGPMCFLILGCLSLCSISIFFFFDKPTVAFCVLRFLPFVLFYTVCLACFVVRSFQIVSIFKIAAKFPQAHSWWMKYHGQWLVISVTFVIQAFLIIVSVSSDPPSPFRDIVSYPDKIILGCFMNLKTSSVSFVLLLLLCLLCFIFSYMGKDLPKNYNEAKAITFCLLLLILTWIIFTTASLLYQGKYIHSLNALAVLSSIYSFLLWYFLPKCYIIIFQPQKNTQKYFQGLIQDYTKTISQ